MPVAPGPASAADAGIASSRPRAAAADAITLLRTGVLQRETRSRDDQGDGRYTATLEVPGASATPMPSAVAERSPDATQSAEKRRARWPDAPPAGLTVAPAGRTITALAVAFRGDPGNAGSDAIGRAR